MASQQQRYRVVERIAAGGMAEVFRAESAGLEGFKKTVAIKRVLGHLSKKKQFIGMFLDEARLSAQLSHSNCVQVFDIGVGDGTYFIVMEYVDGADLKKLLEFKNKLGQRVDVPTACLIGQRICEGLDYAHKLEDSEGKSLGIVHRDMSPPNVLITKYGEVKVVDFGLAKANSQLEHSEPGIIKGKFSYLSPEAASGQEVDYRTDIFATGIILWEMLAGRRLFLGDSDLATVRQVQAAEIPSLRAINPAVPKKLEEVLMTALAKAPEARFPTALEFSTALTDVMFDVGRPVASQDISRLIQAVLVDKEREAKSVRAPDNTTLIGTLIEDAMMEFTSLPEDTEGKEPSQVTYEVGSSPLSIGAFRDHQQWSGDQAAEAKARATLTPGVYQVGNLAALEEDAPGVPLDPSLVGSGEARSASARVPPAAPPAPARSTMIALLTVLVVAAGAAGAYLGGLFQ